MLEVTFYILSKAYSAKTLELIAGSHSDMAPEQSGTSSIPGGRPDNVPDNSGTSSIPGGRLLFACRLAEKAYHKGIYSIIYTESPAQSQMIDDALWTFRNSSFIPHQIVTAPLPSDQPQILISANTLPLQENLTLINLAHHCPTNFERCHRILEIITDEETSKQTGRQRYRQYQQAGAKLETHDL